MDRNTMIMVAIIAVGAIVTLIFVMQDEGSPEVPSTQTFTIECPGITDLSSSRLFDPETGLRLMNAGATMRDGVEVCVMSIDAYSKRNCGTITVYINPNAPTTGEEPECKSTVDTSECQAMCQDLIQSIKSMWSAWTA